MLDSDASHNLMPRVVVESLGLEITRPYKYLCSFDSRKVRCMGLIKDMVVTLAQIPAKSIVMDVVVDDIPPKFGMLLSRSWDSKIKGTLQMDMSYATIPLFGGNKRLYREKRLAYVVSIQDNHDSHPIYVVDTDLGSSIFFNDFHADPEMPIVVEVNEEKEVSK